MKEQLRTMEVVKIEKLDNRGQGKMVRDPQPPRSCARGQTCVAGLQESGWITRPLLAINNLSINKGPTQASNYGPALSRVRSEHPEVDQAYQTGRLSLEAIRDIFPQWF
jgi:hypothetical protein